MTNRCYKCGGRKSEMFLVTFRKLGIAARHGVKVGYSHYLCVECVKSLNMYEEINNG